MKRDELGLLELLTKAGLAYKYVEDLGSFIIGSNNKGIKKEEYSYREVEGTFDCIRVKDSKIFRNVSKLIVIDSKLIILERESDKDKVLEIMDEEKVVVDSSKFIIDEEIVDRSIVSYNEHGIFINMVIANGLNKSIVYDVETKRDGNGVVIQICKLTARGVHIDEVNKGLNRRIRIKKLGEKGIDYEIRIDDLNNVIQGKRLRNEYLEVYGNNNFYFGKQDIVYTFVNEGITIEKVKIIKWEV